MSQISPPIRILLAGSLLFLAVWFAMLRPGGAEEAIEPATPAAATGAAQSAPGAAVQSAQSAANSAGQASAARAGQAPATAPGTAAGTAPGVAPAQGQAPTAAPAVKSEDLKAAGVPTSIADDLTKKVAVLLFWNEKAADDRAVNRAVKKVYRHRGQVSVHRVPIADVAKYAAITRGVNVDQSPTVVVVDKNLGAEALVGYADTTSVDQMVVDAFLTTDGEAVDKVSYLQKLEGYCTGANRRIDQLDEITSPRRFRAAVASLTPTLNRLYSRVRALKPPAQYRAMHRDLVALVKLDQSILRRVNSFVRGGSINTVALRRELARHRAKSYAMDLQLAAAGLTACR